MFKKKGTPKFTEIGEYFINVWNIEFITYKDNILSIHMKTEYITFSPKDGYPIKDLYDSIKKQIEGI